MGQSEEAKNVQEFMEYLMNQYIELQNNSIMLKLLKILLIKLKAYNIVLKVLKFSSKINE